MTHAVRKPPRLPLLLAAVLLAACTAKPVPVDHAAYVGEWNGPDMHLLITADGQVEYHRRRDGVDTHLSAPIATFSGSDFSIGVGLFSTNFRVSVPPHEDAGVWKMVVDGVELTRSGTAIPATGSGATTPEI